MSLEGKYMIAFTKNMNVEAREGPGSKVEHEMEFTITGPGVIEGTLTGRGGGSRAFTGCPNLLYIALPQTVESIAKDAFDPTGMLTIIGARGSCAETFAKENGFPFAVK